MNDKYLTVIQAAKIKRVSTITIYSWIRSKRIDIENVAGHRFIVNNKRFVDIVAQIKCSNFLLHYEEKTRELEDRIAMLEAKRNGK